MGSIGVLTAAVMDNAIAFIALLTAWLPVWSVVVWLAVSSRPWKWAERKSPLTWVAFAFLTFCYFLAALGTRWVRAVLIGPDQPEAQRAAYLISLLEQLLLIAVTGWATYRHKRRKATAGSTATNGED